MECKCGNILGFNEKEGQCWSCKNIGMDCLYDFSHVGIHFSAGLYKPYIHYTYQFWNDKEKRHYREKSFCEMGSEISRKVLDSPQHYGIELFSKIARLVADNQRYLLGEEGIKAYHETIEDRKLVSALSQGSQMDMNTGIIPDVDKEE
jgi:hypothetical protein